MKLLLFASFALIAGSVACSLVFRSSDYFDPSDQLTTVASVPGGATKLVVTSSEIVFATNTTIYWLPKVGGNPKLLRTFGDGELSSLASNGTDTVAWCGAMGVESWKPGGSVVVVDANLTDCSSVDVKGTTLAASASADRDAGDAGYAARIYAGPSFELDAEVPETKPNAGSVNVLVSLTIAGNLYYASDVVGRALRQGEKEPYCPIAFPLKGPREFQAAQLSDGGVVTLSRTKAVTAVATNDVCCEVTPNATRPCPKSSLFLSDTDRAVVIQDPWLYFLADNELQRAAIADSLASTRPTTTLIRSGFGPVTGALATDGTYAYFSAGDQIERLLLPP